MGHKTHKEGTPGEESNQDPSEGTQAQKPEQKIFAFSFSPGQELKQLLQTR